MPLSIISERSSLLDENQVSINKEPSSDQIPHGGHSTTKVSSKWAIWNLVNDIVSPGTVGIPFYVMQSGLGFGVALMVIFAVLTGYTLCMVYDLSQRHKQTSYPDLCSYAFGVPGYSLVCACIFLFNYGGLLAQMIMFGEVIPPVLYDLFGYHKLFQRQIVLAIACLLFLPLAFLKNIANFRFTSLISVSSIIVITGLVVFRLVDKANGDYAPPPSDAMQFIRPTVFSALGGLSYIFVCHDLNFNVVESLRDPTPRRYYPIAIVTMLITVITTLLIGVSGFLLFYDRLTANILDLFPPKDLVATVGRVILAVDICITIPFSIFMPRFSIMTVIGSVTKRPDIRDSQLCYILVTTFVMGSALAIAENVTNLGSVFELVGGISACTLAYILPPVIFLKVEDGLNFKKRFLPLVALLCGMIILVGSSFQVFYGMFE